MAIENLRLRVAQVFYQRCFYLFFAVLTLLLILPFLPDTFGGRLALSVCNMLIMIAAVAAVGRSTISFVAGLLLALPSLVFQYLAVDSVEQAHYLALARNFGAALYTLVIAYLLRYVLREEVMTADKLYGAAAAFLMLGVLWAYLYGLLQYYAGDSFVKTGSTERMTTVEVVCFSFGMLTSNGGGDIAPISGPARILVMLEQIVGVLFVAVLIARLAGIYPPEQKISKPNP